MGAVAGPFDAWLVMRGIKTLAVRMDRHSANAARVAEMLAAHPQGDAGATTRACPSTPGTRSPPSRCGRFGGMVSFRVAGGEEAAVAVCDRAEAVHARASRWAASSR